MILGDGKLCFQIVKTGDGKTKHCDKPVVSTWFCDDGGFRAVVSVCEEHERMPKSLGYTKIKEIA